MKKTFLFLSTIYFSLASAFGQPDVSPRLQKALNTSKPDDYIKVLIYLKDQVDVEKLDAQLYLEKAAPETRSFKVITALQEKAASTQGALINFLEEKSATERCICL